MKPGWTTIGVLDLVSDTSRLATKLPQSGYLDRGPIPVIDQGMKSLAGFTDEESYLYRGSTPVVLFGDHTRVVKFVDHPFVVGADGVKVLTPKPGIDARYAYHVLRSLDVPAAGYSRHFKFLKEMSVPRPPLDEQRRIAVILDHVDAIRQSRDASIRATLALNEAIFFDMFGNPLDPANPLPRVRIGDLGRVVTGNSPSRDDARNFGDLIEWIKTDNISLGLPELSRASEFLSDIGAARARIAPAGSVLVACIAGSRRSIGKSAIADRAVTFNQQINAIVPSTDRSSRFIHAQLSFAPELVRAKSTGGMKGLVSKSSFEAIELLDPTRQQQREFTVRVAKVDAIRAAAKRHLATLDALFDSLQSRAFAGEIGTSE